MGWDRWSLLVVEEAYVVYVEADVEAGCVATVTARVAADVRVICQTVQPMTRV